MSNRSKCVYLFDRYRLDPSERLLLRDNRTVRLSPKAFEILLVLVKNSGRLVEKEELMTAIWPDSFVEEGSLTKNISILRKALSDGSSNCQFIKTVPKYGYRLSGVIEILLL